MAGKATQKTQSQKLPIKIMAAISYFVEMKGTLENKERG